jgi:hypothetical protein
MPGTLWTILVAAVTAVVTAIATGLFVTPRLEARKKRIGEAHAARDTFNAHLRMVVSACGRLQLLRADNPAWTPVLRERVTAERERWLQQLDDATRWMVDHLETYAGSWAMVQHIDFVVPYAGNARMLMLSELDEATKLELLTALTLPVRRQAFGFWWYRVLHRVDDRRAFTETLARLTGGPTAP